MVKFIGKRLAYAVLTLFLITTATFFLVAGAPGDPIAAKVGQMPEQAQEIIREKYGLDQPVVKRYTTYMKNLLTTGDFGESIIYTGQSANDIIKNNTLVSAKIGLLGLLFQTTIGICLGMVAALNRGKPVDHVIRVLVVLAICVPSFVFASVLQYFLAFKWKLVPVFGWGQMKHYILPVAAYAIGGIASYTKYMRNSTLSVIGEDYIITAKAKGCTKKRVVRKHVLRNAMLPIITMIGPSLAGIFAGAGYMVESNKEHGEGRSDVIVFDSRNGRVAVFEAKYSRTLNQMEPDCEKAIRQIDARKYAEEFEDYYDEVLCYGISFYKKRCLIKRKER